MQETKGKVYNILTNGTQLESVILKMISDLYFKSDIIKVYSYDSKEFKKYTKNERPFFSDKYLLILYTRNINSDEIESICKQICELEYYDVVLIHNRRQYFDIINTSLSNAKTINLNTPPEWLVDKYLDINFKYNLSLHTKENFYKRMYGQWVRIDEAIVLLESYLDGLDLDKDEIVKIDNLGRIIPKIKRINFLDLILDIILCNNLTHHITILSDYKYATRYTYKEVLQKLDFLIQVKKDIILGNLKVNMIMEYSNSQGFSHHEVDKVYYYLSLPSTKLEKLEAIKRKLVTQHKNDILGFILDNNITGVRRKKFEPKLS